MNKLVKEILYDVLEIQKEKLAKAKDDMTNAKDVLRITTEIFLERTEKVKALEQELKETCK